MAAQTHRAAAGPFTALSMIIYNWAGEVKAEFKTVLAPAAIMVLVAITLLCNGVAGFLSGIATTSGGASSAR